MATDYTRLPNTIGKPTEGELSVAEQEDGGLFDTGDGTTGVGAPGTEGPKGDTGDAGATGPQGDTGPQGPRGYQGVSIEGPTGPEGDKGDTGLTGDTGIDGATGPNGPKGDMGTSGTDGTDGSTGPTGPEGPKGDIGATGTSVTGPAGPQGPKGDTGDASTVVGPTGPPGVQGPTGSSGNEGPKGDMGTQGETGGVGPEGPQGVQGTTGMTGGTGSTGLTGAAGPTGPEGNIGPTGARGTEGPKGQTGDKGDTGVQGSSGIGEKGATGATGPSGPEGDVGAQGERGPGGGDKGDKGDTGDTGPPGQDAQGAILTDADIKFKYESNDDTNAFTDFDKDKLDSAIAEWNTNVEYSLNEDVTFEGNLYRFKEDFSAVIYEVSVNEFAIRNVNGIDQFVSVFEGGIKVVNSVLISGNDVTKNDDGSYTVQGSLKSYHSDPVLQDTTNETGSIIISKTDHYGVVIQIHSTGENPTIDTAHWDQVTGGAIHGTFITDAERAKLAGIETGATTDQDLSSYTGAWVAVRQYLNNEQVSFEGKLYDNTEILIRQTYDVGVNEMEVQADNGIDDFIIINDEDNGSSLVIVNVNDARVLSGTNGGNYVVLIGHRKYTSIGVSRATGTLSATRTLANFEMRVDDVALAGESPIDKPLNWLQISLTEAELNAKLSTALGPYLTTVDHLSNGITEFNNLIAYEVGDIVYYKDPTNTSEEQIFYEVLLSSGAAGVDANGDPRTPLNDIGGPDGLNRFFRIVASALQGTKADDALNILDIKLDGDETTTLSTATLTGSSSISFTSDEGVTKVFTVPAVVSANDGVITIEQNGNVIGDFTTNQAANKTIKLLNTTTTVINETTITNAVDYVLNTFYADETQVKFEDHYYEKYGEPGLYLGVWASIDPYLPTRIVSHNGFYYVASGNGATPGQEPNTGAVDGDGEQAWVLIDINPVDYSGVWKPLVAGHFTITANEGGSGAILSTLDINGTNYVIPAGIPWLDYLVGKLGEMIITDNTTETTWSFTFGGTMYYRRKLKNSNEDKIYSDFGFTTQVASRYG